MARPSEVESHEEASEHILKELHRIIASQERIEGRFSVLHAEVKAEVQEMRAAVTTVKEEVQQVRAEVTAEVQQVRDAVQEWRAEMERKVRTVELNEARLRTQILGTAEGFVRVEQNLQEEVARMCAQLEMMQHEQEKKKGNEEELLKALVREYVEKLAQQLEEQEDAKLQEYQQSLEEWLKRGQRKFQSTIAERVFATKIVAAPSPHGTWRRPGRKLHPLAQLLPHLPCPWPGTCRQPCVRTPTDSGRSSEQLLQRHHLSNLSRDNTISATSCVRLCASIHLTPLLAPATRYYSH